MKWIVNNPDGYATRLRDFRGGTLTLVNSSAVDVYYDIEAVGGTINSTAPGVVPLGTKIANGGGVAQFAAPCPDNIWVRAISQTTLDVQGDAEFSGQASSPVPNAPIPAGDNRGNLNVFHARANIPTRAKPTISLGSPTTGRFFQGLEKKYLRG